MTGTDTPHEDSLAVRFADIEAAAERLRGHAIETPLLTNAALDATTSARILLKPELLQHAGSFKFRGAFNRLVQLEAAERKAGVVAWSSGNHAQGVACAGHILGIKTLIVMPADAPKVKVDNTRAYGADIRFYDRKTESREEIGREIVRRRGAVLVPSYDDPHIIAGQGTVGLEMVAQAQARGILFDDVLVSCGGGGLVAGMATAIRHRLPATRVWSVEPANFDDTARSLEAGERLAVLGDTASICDALLAPMPGELTFPINLRLLAGGLAVDDEDVMRAMTFAFSKLKLVVEPGGAVALAAVLSRKIETRGRTIGVVMSGGNVDAELFQQALHRR